MKPALYLGRFLSSCRFLSPCRWPDRVVRPAVLCLLAIVWMSWSPLLAQEESLDPGLIQELTGQRIDVVLTNQKILANHKVILAPVDESTGGLSRLKVQAPGETRSRTIRLNQVQEIFVRDRPLDVRYDRRNRVLVHDPERRQQREAHQEQVARQLAGQRAHYWPILDDTDHEQFLEKHRQFVQRTKQSLPQLKLQTIETQRFIFTTDLSPEAANVYIAYLDDMYGLLCEAFGRSPDKNLWCGKCVVFTFRQEETYHFFEQQIMDVDARGSQGLCHQSSDGTVIFAGFQGDNGSFGHVLVHETTHGFIHRYLSSARIPSWLNEGIADWMANAVVRGERGARRARQSAQLAVVNGGIGDLLTTDRIPAGTYGTACSLVEILVARDQGGQFKQFVVLMKEGREPETALQESFGLTYGDLQALYALRIRQGR